jgi:protein-S-isoprenylcysteine O-methyltransferase Ste14
VIARAVAGSLVLLLLLGLAIFLPAGTVRYWQAWVYFAVFAVSVSLITAYLARYDRALLARRLEAGPTAEREALQRVLSAIANVTFLLLYVVAALDWRRHGSHVPAIASLIADGGVVAGFAIVFVTFRANSFTRATIRATADQTLVDDGPYGVVRHPMYAGALLMLIATPVALGSFWGLVAVVPMIATIVARLLDEERFLSAHLRGYSQYLARVRYRLVPRVW